MKIVINTDKWTLIRWIRRKFNLAPKDWWTYHLKSCGTQYRGCDPKCPKDIYENTGKWTY